MDKVEGIDQVFQAGTYAVFTLKKGAKAPSKEALTKSFEKMKMKLVSLEKEARKLPVKAYALGIKPVT